MYTSLDPEPQIMERDNDGNWIATYEIASQNSLEVYLTGKANIYLEPQTNSGQDEFIQTAVPAPNSDELESQTYWETNNSQIKDLAQKYATPKSIYDYVVSHLTYDYSKVGGESVNRLGAVGALNQPTNAACQEFTDLFIAIARAASIPARRDTGFAYTANSRLRPLSLIEDVLTARKKSGFRLIPPGAIPPAALIILINLILII